MAKEESPLLTAFLSFQERIFEIPDDEFNKKLEDTSKTEGAENDKLNEEKVKAFLEILDQIKTDVGSDKTPSDDEQKIRKSFIQILLLAQAANPTEKSKLIGFGDRDKEKNAYLMLANKKGAIDETVFKYFIFPSIGHFCALDPGESKEPLFRSFVTILALDSTFYTLCLDYMMNLILSDESRIPKVEWFRKKDDKKGTAHFLSGYHGVVTLQFSILIADSLRNKTVSEAIGTLMEADSGTVALFLHCLKKMWNIQKGKRAVNHIFNIFLDTLKDISGRIDENDLTRMNIATAALLFAEIQSLTVTVLKTH